MRLNLFYKYWLFLFVLTFIQLFFSCQDPNVSSKSENVPQNLNSTIQEGKSLFEWQCSRCHGINGSGGLGPSLNTKFMVNAPNQNSLKNVIRNGIPGTEMPGSWQLDNNQIDKIAGYVSSLASDNPVLSSGNVMSGKAIFEGSGNCKSCHTIHGDGGILGPDLSSVGGQRSATYLREILLDPGSKKTLPTKDGYTPYLVVNIESKEGKRITGMRMNEDAFSIQLKDANNNFHSFSKKDLSKLEKRHGISFMPSVKDVISENELDDLVAFLSSLKPEK